MEPKHCPSCRSTHVIQSTPPFWICGTCGETRHYSQWKTAEQLTESEARVDAVVDAVLREESLTEQLSRAWDRMSVVLRQRVSEGGNLTECHPGMAPSTLLVTFAVPWNSELEQALVEASRVMKEG